MDVKTKYSPIQLWFYYVLSSITYFCICVPPPLHYKHYENLNIGHYFIMSYNNKLLIQIMLIWRMYRLKYVYIQFLYTYKSCSLPIFDWRTADWSPDLVNETDAKKVNSFVVEAPIFVWFIVDILSETCLLVLCVIPSLLVFCKELNILLVVYFLVVICLLVFWTGPPLLMV